MTVQDLFSVRSVSSVVVFILPQSSQSAQRGVVNSYLETCQDDKLFDFKLSFMVWSHFTSYYSTPRAIVWAAWDPHMQHRGSVNAEAWEKVDIRKSAEEWATPPDLTQKLNSLITKEIYQTLMRPGEVDVPFLSSRGFKILKDSATRIVFHEECPGWLIKVGVREVRELPMESTVKLEQAHAQNMMHTVKKPVRNPNLLRAAGRAFFIKQLADLSANKRKYFDFPQEYIYTIPHAPADANPHQRYFSVSEKKNIYSGNETLAFIHDQDVETQREIAKKIVAFIKRTRIHDLHKNNLVLSKDKNHWCFEIIDMEPLGILIDSEDTSANLFQPVEHVLLGLISFRDRYCRRHGLTTMAEEVDQAIVDYLKEHHNLNVRVDNPFVDREPTTLFQRIGSAVLIIVSLLLIIIPIALFIISFIAACCCPADQATIRLNTPGINHLSI